jgi:hypothetical protein
MKSNNYLFSCFLLFEEEDFKVKKITHPRSGSQIQGVKKAPDPQHCSPFFHMCSENFMTEKSLPKKKKYRYVFSISND